MPLVRFIGKPDPLQRELDRQEAQVRQQLAAGVLAPRPGETAETAARREGLARARQAFRAKGITEAQVWEYNHRRLGGAGPKGEPGVVSAAIPGITIRLLGPAEGLSQTYQWGPHAFTVPVQAGDWAVIQRLPERDQFVLAEE